MKFQYKTWIALAKWFDEVLKNSHEMYVINNYPHLDTYLYLDFTDFKCRYLNFGIDSRHFHSTLCLNGQIVDVVDIIMALNLVTMTVTKQAEPHDSSSNNGFGKRRNKIC